MKRSKEELLAKIDEYDISDEVKLELMEDISDSIEVETEDRSGELEEIKKKYEDLKIKYKERFLAPVDKKDKEEIVEEGLEEKKEIDVKEI